MATRELPSPELLRKLLDYNPETGELIWKSRDCGMFASPTRAPRMSAIWNKRKAGKRAASPTKWGYMRLKVLNADYQAHRVAWAIHYGEWPSDCIDHINHDRADNRIANLRSVTQAENAKNQTISRSNTSGVTGVRFAPREGKWIAQIKHHRRLHHLGTFAKFEDAVLCRKAAEQHFGFHPNHGTDAKTLGGANG